MLLAIVFIIVVYFIVDRSLELVITLSYLRISIVTASAMYIFCRLVVRQIINHVLQESPHIVSGVSRRIMIIVLVLGLLPSISVK